MLNIWVSKIRKWIYSGLRTFLNLTYVRNTFLWKFLSQVQGSNDNCRKHASVLQRLGAVCRHFVLRAFLAASSPGKPGTRLSTICKALLDRELMRHLGRCLFLITCVIFTRKQAVEKPANHQNICCQRKAGINSAQNGYSLSNCSMERCDPQGGTTKSDIWSTKCHKHLKKKKK